MLPAIIVAFMFFAILFILLYEKKSPNYNISRNQPTTNSGIATNSQISKTGKDVLELIDSALPTADRVLPLMTLAAIIDYSTNYRPPFQTVKECAVFKKSDPKGRGFLIYQVFLDENDRLVCFPNGRPYGRKIVAQEINTELSNAFGEHDLIIIG